MAIFSKFFVDVMTHIIRDNAAKRIKLFFELFINKNYEFIFVSFSSSHTLCVKEDPPLESRGGTSFTLSIDAFKEWNLL
jgi:hypothetical protein